MCPNTCPRFTHPCVRAATPVSRHLPLPALHIRHIPPQHPGPHCPHTSASLLPSCPASTLHQPPHAFRLRACVPSCPTPPLWPPAMRCPSRPVPMPTTSQSALLLLPAWTPLPPHQLRSSISIHTIHGRRYCCGHYWATRRYTSLHPPPSHDHGCHSLSPEAAAYGRGGSMIPKLSGFACYPWPMSLLPVPSPTPQQRVAFPTHGGFPSPRAASSLNDRSGVSTPPVPTAAKSKDNRVSEPVQ
jgi:hypothetical protein